MEAIVEGLVLVPITISDSSSSSNHGYIFYSRQQNISNADVSHRFKVGVCAASTRRGGGRVGVGEGWGRGNGWGRGKDGGGGKGEGGGEPSFLYGLWQCDAGTQDALVLKYTRLGVYLPRPLDGMRSQKPATIYSLCMGGWAVGLTGVAIRPSLP